MVIDLEVCEVVRDIRINNEQTQLQFGFDYDVTRETISKIENGHQKIPMDISRKIMNKFDDPRLAMSIRREYTRTGTQWLDGPNVDLHRSSVKEKTLEELQEALSSLINTSLAKPLSLLSSFDIQNVKSMLKEIIEAITASEHLVAVICAETGISYTGIWDEHYQELKCAGYIGGTK